MAIPRLYPVLGRHRSYRNKAIRLILLFAAVFTGTAAEADEMRFLPGGNDTRCRECGFVQAIGPISESTPARFAELVENTRFLPRRVRLHSQGGNLAAGVRLGEMFREMGFATEVGSDHAICDTKESCRDGSNPDSWPYFGDRASERRPGTCASACAYAFLGGVERIYESPSRLGFHRFYFADAINRPVAKYLAGAVLDSAQEKTASLVLYALNMGVDAKVVALATETSADQMHWISPQEADDLRIRYSPLSWQRWRLETYEGGAFAISETVDGDSSMMAYCLQDGRAFVDLSLRHQEREWGIADWFEQVRDCPFDGFHPVFGDLVPERNVRVSRDDDGWSTITFQLESKNPSLKTPALLDRAGSAYPMACSSYEYQGTTDNFRESVRVAMKACLR